jgi:sulfane dehydrogenase subunit SoxC
VRENKLIKQVAGAGLLDRRSFILSGMAFSAAYSVNAMAKDAGAVSRIGKDLPNWMTSPGQADVAYGRPAAYEHHIRRHLAGSEPETSLFSVWHTPIENQRGIITPSGLHFSVHHNGVPDIDPEKHQLMIHGLVEKPLKFDLEALMRYPMVSNINFLECAGNTAPNAVSLTALDHSCQELSGQVSGSEWAGVPVKYLLQEAGIKPAAKWVIVEGADGGSHARSIPLSKLLDDAIIALYQNGERIRPSQGYPMRLFVPGWEGNVNVKWLHRLEVTDTPAYTKDESGLYSDILDDGRIQRFSFHMEVKSVITHPSGKQVLPEKMGFYEISGLAWSGRGKVKQVDVSADGGKTWAQAKLDGPILNKSLTRFSIPWRWEGKETLLLSRATDEQGNVQPTRELWRDRYASHSFNHYNAIQAWHISREGRVSNTYV